MSGIKAVKFTKNNGLLSISIRLFGEAKIPSEKDKKTLRKNSNHVSKTIVLKVPYTNKHKILNDPIYGFITIPSKTIFDLIEHPYFQRLRRISQLGLSYLVYPGAYHTRFHHALGAMYLMQQAIDVLRSKGHQVTDEEAEAVSIAILLHDIGHGPFSHALEHSIVNHVTHEQISLLFMNKFNELFEGKLDLAIRIFKGQYPRTFLHQLISSQLDVDRLDYLKRDSFYSGAVEGQINSDRLITMLNVADDELVIDAKGIYSVEKFIIARRLMYWQVYLHKTVLAAEFMLVEILRRAKDLVEQGTDLFCTSAFRRFLYQSIDAAAFENDPGVLDDFSRLDDADLLCALKEWTLHEDPVLSMLCKRLINRKLLRTELQNTPFDEEKIHRLKEEVKTLFNLKGNEADYFVFTDKVGNSAYKSEKDTIKLLYKDGSVVDIADASDQPESAIRSYTVTKYFLCYPKECKRS